MLLKYILSKQNRASINTFLKTFDDFVLLRNSENEGFGLPERWR